jgi:hypothetical protein
MLNRADAKSEKAVLVLAARLKHLCLVLVEKGALSTPDMHRLLDRADAELEGTAIAAQIAPRNPPQNPGPLYASGLLRTRELNILSDLGLRTTDDLLRWAAAQGDDLGQVQTELLRMPRCGPLTTKKICRFISALQSVSQ